MRKILAVFILSLALVGSSFADKYYRSVSETNRANWSRGAKSYYLNNEISKEVYEAMKKKALEFGMAIYETTNEEGEKFEMFFLFYRDDQHKKTQTYLRKIEKEEK